MYGILHIISSLLILCPVGLEILLDFKEIRGRCNDEKTDANRKNINWNWIDFVFFRSYDAEFLLGY